MLFSAPVGPCGHEHFIHTVAWLLQLVVQLQEELDWIKTKKTPKNPKPQTKTNYHTPKNPTYKAQTPFFSWFSLAGRPLSPVFGLEEADAGAGTAVVALIYLQHLALLGLLCSKTGCTSKSGI